ncbi:hypothetical protein B5D80_11065 [Micromonospora wenchangensis]|uniref:Uncharacterized protein n=1 Tax=Micromonospora wenchangensis TaxID=1185415 RepID=A0A246RQ94_9ACTN|nr:hypothetical protein [Micromonospora wenchangensis]OWV08887.1 hypothetical protein B5D80_11065 [Micromonospora wenchangensis]
MILQPYPLWLAQEMSDLASPLVGAVIGWQPPPSNEAAYPQELSPVFVTQGDDHGGGGVYVAVSPWFIGPTAAEARELALEYARPRRQEQEAAQELERRNQQREDATGRARRRAEGGDLEVAKALAETSMRPRIPKLVAVLADAEWKRTDARRIELRVRKRTPVMDVVTDWQNDVRAVVQSVLGDDWQVDIRMPGLLGGLR